MGLKYINNLQIIKAFTIKKLLFNKHMSTKKLSRTLVEGGRSGYNKWERKFSHKKFRARTREYLNNVNKNFKYFDFVPEPILEKNRTFNHSFNIKINALTRWIHSHIGQKWDDVRSEMSNKINSRTASGHSIFYNEFLRCVEETPDFSFGRSYSSYEEYIQSNYKNGFYVDSDGILQEKICIRHRKNSKKELHNFDANKMIDWLANRLITNVSSKLFWLEPVLNTKKYGKKDYLLKMQLDGYNINWLVGRHEAIKQIDKDGYELIIGYDISWRRLFYFFYDNCPKFRQSKELSISEYEYYNSIPDIYKDKITENY